MYEFPWTASANDAIWAFLRERLRAAGVRCVPESLERSRPLPEVWRDPGLLLGQTCGLPLVAGLGEGVRVVGTPCYDLPGCDGPWHRSFIVVRAGDPAAAVSDLRGRRCAMNGEDSNTGMNLLRAAIAPIAEGRPFFGEVLTTGAHLASLAAVRDGLADVAAIDCVTHGLTARHSPALLQGTRVLASTPPSPGLPLIAAAATPPGDVAALRQALDALFAADQVRPSLEALAWVGWRALSEADYAVVATLARDAGEQGYSRLS